MFQPFLYRLYGYFGFLFLLMTYFIIFCNVSILSFIASYACLFSLDVCLLSILEAFCKIIRFLSLSWRLWKFTSLLGEAGFEPLLTISFQLSSFVILSDRLKSLNSTWEPRLNPLRLGVISARFLYLDSPALDYALDDASPLWLFRELCLDLPCMRSEKYSSATSGDLLD